MGRLAARGVSRRIRLPLPADPLESAKLAGLRYTTDERPGIRRLPVGKSFRYVGTDGKVVKDRATLERIRSLVIPPAWTDVWICPDPNGHLQVTGRDAKGRKQYRYHPAYRAVRDETKFSRMLAFARALPGIRRRVAEDIALPGLPRRKVLATVLRLLEVTSIRVGNEEYARDNDSYGLTTLRDGHVKISGDKLRFRFRGKSGKEHDLQLNDRRLARIVKNCQDLPGEELFQYVDADGQQCQVNSETVNEYLREIAGEEFTAKDFRTWNGTVLAALALQACGACQSATENKKNVVTAIKNVSEQLRNRPATCRKYYVHPAVLDAYTQGTLLDTLKGRRAGEGLSAEEACVAGLLESHVKQQLKELRPAV